MTQTQNKRKRKQILDVGYEAKAKPKCSTILTVPSKHAFRDQTELRSWSRHLDTTNPLRLRLRLYFIQASSFAAFTVNVVGSEFHLDITSNFKTALVHIQVRL